MPLKNDATAERCTLRVRRLALAAMLAEGGVPRPEQFVRAGLPPLVRAVDMVIEALEKPRPPQKRLSGPPF
jgi:hypothetical protein